jgi:hypothetical protein
MENTGTSRERSKGQASGREVCRRLVGRLFVGLRGIVMLGNA